MTVVHEVRLIQVDPHSNANKMYVLTLDSSGTLTRRWGRVGATGQTKVEPNRTRLDLDDAVYAKERRGYTRVEATDTPKPNAPAAATNTAALAAAARASLIAKPNKTLDALIERIVAANKHAIELASGGQITFTTTGQATTALGPVSTASVTRARHLMDEIVTLPTTDNHRARLVADYLTLVPQKVPAKRGWHETFAADSKAQAKQYDLLDALVTVVPAAQPAGADTTGTPEVHFRYKVTLADKATTKRVTDKFEAEKSPNHPSARLRVKRVYALTDDTGHAAAFEKRASEVRNRHEWFHGSRTHNILNILRTGLYMPMGNGAVSGMDFHGQMFGNGTYFGKASKAANYAIGGVWSGTRESGSTFLFLADITCGSEYRSTDPLWVKHGWRGSRSTQNARGNAWDSIYVRGGTAGVINDERVIWNEDQIRLAYLLELG